MSCQGLEGLEVLDLWSEDRTTLAAALDRSFSDYGLAMIRLTPQESASISSTREAVRSFFELDDDQKGAVHSPSGGPGLLPGTRRGFVGYAGSPTANGSQGGYAALMQGVPDRRESFTAGIHPFCDEDTREASIRHDDDGAYLEAEGGIGRLFMQNVWPEGQVGVDLRNAWTAHYAAIKPLQNQIYGVMAEILGFPEEVFQHERDFSEFQGNYYLATAPQPDSPTVKPVLERQTRMCPHKDGTDFTLLAADPSVPHSHLTTAGRAGKEALPSAPNVPYTEDTLVILIGTALQKWSNDRWYAPVHSVEMPSEEEVGKARVSIVHFVHADYDKTLTAPPSVKLSDRNYADMSIRDHFWSPFFNGPPKNWLEPLPSWEENFESKEVAP